MHATFELVAERISITSGTPVALLHPDTMIKDLALDSFLLVEMAVDLQEEFDAIFSQEALQRVVTITDLVDLLNASQVELLRARFTQAAVSAPAEPANRPPLAEPANRPPLAEPANRPPSASPTSAGVTHG